MKYAYLSIIHQLQVHLLIALLMLLMLTMHQPGWPMQSVQELQTYLQLLNLFIPQKLMLNLLLHKTTMTTSKFMTLATLASWYSENAIYNLSLGARPSPISTNIGLPYVVWKLGSTPSDSNASIKVHTDSCASLNVGNELCHFWLMTNFPSIVESYTCFNDIQGWKKIH